MIYCFSGNGNSLCVARSLASRLGEEVTRISRDALSAPESVACSGGNVIWVFPVYSWGIPLHVRAFMSRVTVNGARHFMVATCGDDVGLTHLSWRSVVASRGWEAMAAFSVQMPNTYTLLPGFDVDSPEVEAEKLRRVSGRLDFITARIVSGWRGDDVCKGAFPWLKSRLIYPWFMKYSVRPQRFRCDASRCISCGKCEAACPVGNVSFVDGHPRWGADCALCLACYHVCPVHAVNYGNATVRKGQYRCPLELLI